MEKGRNTKRKTNNGKRNKLYIPDSHQLNGGKGGRGKGVIVEKY